MQDDDSLKRSAYLYIFSTEYIHVNRDCAVSTHSDSCMQRQQDSQHGLHGPLKVS